MRTEADFERAFQKFKDGLDAMSDEDFFLTLGTTIEELREKAKDKVFAYGQKAQEENDGKLNK